jgi:predicted nucleic acid-binding protein
LIVIDTNILVHLIIPGRETADSEALLRKDPNWAAPLLLRSEFRNVLAVYLRRKSISLKEAFSAMTEAEMILGENEFEVKSESVLELCAQSNCSAYDCEYAALALALRVPLITRDKALLAAFPDTAVSPEKFLLKR